MNWGLLLILLLAVGVLLYVWRRNVRSIKQLGEAVKADVRRLCPQRPQPVAPVAPPMAPGAYAHRRRRY